MTVEFVKAEGQRHQRFFIPQASEEKAVEIPHGKDPQLSQAWNWLEWREEAAAAGHLSGSQGETH